MNRLTSIGPLLLIIILSCSALDNFEKTLGKQQVRALDKWVDEFKEFLNLNLPELDTKDAYNKFLKDMSEGNFKQYKSHLQPGEMSQLNASIRESGLWEEIWSNKEVFNDREDEIIFIPRNSNKKVQQETKYFNTYGKYLNALKALNSQDSLITDYIKVKEVAGDISRNLIAYGLLHFKPDYSDKIIQCIIAIEFGWILFKPEE